MTTARASVEPVLAKQDAKEGPDEPDESRTADLSVIFGPDAEEARSSNLVHAPPERAEKFLHFVLPCEREEDRIGDLEEKFREVMLPRYGHRSAVRWYWFQVAFIAEERVRAWIGMSIGAAVAWMIGKIGS